MDDASFGTLKYVTDYTGFSGSTELQSGNYLALKVSGIPSGATVTMQKVGPGASPAVTLDSDLNAVVRMTELKTLRFTITYNGETLIKDISLENLVLEPAPEVEEEAVPEAEANPEEVVG